MSDDMNLACGDCGAHYVVSPSGSIDSAACSECGGKRFYRNQPSPTQSDGALRDMVNMDTGKDAGGNPLGEGIIMSHVHQAMSECPVCRLPVNHDSACPQCGTLVPTDHMPGVENNIQGDPLSEGTIMGEDGEQSLAASTHQRDNFMHSHIAPLSHRVMSQEFRPETLNMEPYPTLWSDDFMKTADNTNIWNQQTEGPGGAYTAPVRNDANQGMSAGQWAELGGAALGLGALGVGAGAALGGDALATGAADVAKSAPSLMGRVLQKVPSSVMKGIGVGTGENVVNDVAGGGSSGASGGSAMPSAPDELQGLQAFGSTDIPALLMLADLETPGSVKSVDEHHDDPEKQDQKEFNDEDYSPSNFHNPNNEDSGVDGEDGVREAEPGYGFGPDSPGIQRMQTLMPLLMHYITNGISGADDPLVQGLHEALESENPGYLDNEHPEGQKILEIMVNDHKSKPKTSSRLSLAPVPTPSSGVQPTPMPGSDITPPQQGQLCPRCGAPLAADGTCPQCGYKTHPQGGNIAPQTSMPSPVIANHQGPVTDEQKQAIKQLVDTRPELFGDILHEIQNQPNTAPLVDPNEDPAPPPMAPPGAGGAMPVPDPSQAGGGMQQPMQPMAALRTADANNAIPRCPKCDSATTSYCDGVDGDSGHHARCHSCQHTWALPKHSRRLVALNTPLDISADEQNMARPQEGQQAGDVWTDANGNPLVVGEIYSLKAPQYPVPDEVQIVSKKPHELGVRLVGEFGGIQNPGDPNQPDFRLTPQDLTTQEYTFEPVDEASSADQGADQPPLGGTPGMEQIPEQPPTTDQVSNTYPNRGTTSSVADEDEDNCRKCGNTWIEHTASTATRTIHECARCGNAWETEDSEYGREANADLSWIMQSSGPANDDFFAEYERRQGSGGGRNIRDIAAKDTRLQAVRNTLEANAQDRARTAGRHFSPNEQRELINEFGDARNADRLDLSGTHYLARHDETGKANGLNAPDEHLIFGL